jgi:hypothetical protein
MMTRIFQRSLAAGLCAAIALSISLHAQEFKLGSKTVQVHGFGTQGFIHTDDNNWLTMNTSKFGSGAFTDVGLNLSSQLSSQVRVAAQGYDRKLGQLGNWHPQFDFYMVDVKVKPWLGFRGGKVKTVLGLFTDTQDMDFDHTFALLPQSVYPIDMRDATIAHVGGDIYGKVKLPNKYGSLAYTAYGGHRSDSKYSGYPYLLAHVAPGVSVLLSSYSGPIWGGDLRWNAAGELKGRTVGASRLNESIAAKGTFFGQPYWEQTNTDWTNQFYGKYAKNNLHLESEYKREYQNKVIFDGSTWVFTDVRGWYISGGYKISKWFEAGSYYSHYRVNYDGGPLVPGGIVLENFPDPQRRDFDKVVTGKVTFNQYLTLKVEGHFMAGNGSAESPNGFYSSVNSTIQDNTNALVVRAGFSF